MKKYIVLLFIFLGNIDCVLSQDRLCDRDGLCKCIECRSDKVIDNIARTSFADSIFTVDKVTAANRDREFLQSSINRCSISGGGTVVVKSGRYLLDGNIVLRSDVNLHLEEGAELVFSGKADDFLPVVFTRWEGTELYGRSPMIYALHATNIAITGKGVINASAGKEFGMWEPKEGPDRDRLRDMGSNLTNVKDRVFGKGTLLRPSCIQLIGCSRILIEDVTVKDSPFWTIHPVYCDNVIVRGVTIESHFPNNDGCDPESTTNVLIEKCIFNSGDDAIAIKSGRDADGRSVGRSSKNIVIRNCLFNSKCNGLCIGSEMSGGVENVIMYNIEIKNVKNAIYFKSNRDRGGYIRDVFIDNIKIEHTSGAMLRFESNYFGFRGGNMTSEYKNFNISNVIGDKSDNYAIFIDGYGDKPINGIKIEGFSVKNATYPYYKKCATNIELKNVTVNGKALPSTLKESEQRKTLDIY